jgi:restriction endonuclease S subunit
MTELLGHIAHIQCGHPFRGSVPEVPDGNGYALQMRDLNSDGSITWTSLVRTSVDGRREPDWLIPGDVVFVARGLRNYAVCLSEVLLPTVCSQYFFLLRCKSAQISPEFLAWQINRAPCQRYLAKNAEGSDQLSIRRSVLENLPIVVPPRNAQEQIVALHQEALSERRVFERLIHNREQQLDALAFDLFSAASNFGSRK